MSAIRVVIADDHPIVLVGLEQMILRTHGFTLVGEAVSSSELIEQLLKHQPELLITDFNMPGDDVYGDGLKMIEYVVRNFPNTKVIVLTMISNSLIMNRLKALGVASVIQKNYMHEEIESVLVSLLARTGLQNGESKKARQSTSLVEVDDCFSNLSPREVEVLRLLVAGMSVNEIARQLNRSKKTVSAQKMSAMRKLDVNSDFSLISYCVNMNVFS